MKVFNAVVSFKIENKFSKENFENEIMDYSDEIEDLLDYDCLVFDPEVISEEEDSVTVSIPVDAYIEIIDEKGNAHQATIRPVKDEANAVAVYAEGVEHPQAARYCFRNFLLGNLANMRNIPIVPFRTDK